MILDMFASNGCLMKFQNLQKKMTDARKEAQNTKIKSNTLKWNTAQKCANASDTMVKDEAMIKFVRRYTYIFFNDNIHLHSLFIVNC